MTTTRMIPESPKFEDALFLAETGENLTGAIRRLGYQSRDGLYNLCHRHGRADVFATLAGRDAQ